jgi:predicted NACHT family NTPase
LDGLLEPKEDNYIVTFVTTGTKARPNIHFCDDWRKSRAYVVTGESGSGKTWFAKQSLRRQTNLEKAAFIYKEI